MFKGILPGCFQKLAGAGSAAFQCPSSCQRASPGGHPPRKPGFQAASAHLYKAKQRSGDLPISALGNEKHRLEFGSLRAQLEKIAALEITAVRILLNEGPKREIKFIGLQCPEISKCFYRHFLNQV
ncbi:MAG: hypothetical protein KDD10_28845 [Phaeodactylibacter sp.]|nr:hypothetical protein [Phaeodactylibacter sp.]